MGKRTICSVTCRCLAVLLLCVCNTLPSAALVKGSALLQQAAQPEAATSQPAQPNASGNEPLTLNDHILQDVLEPLRIGLQSQNINLVLSVFDKSQLSNYSDLEQELAAFYQQYAEVHFRYQLLQATQQNDHASATVQIDMDAIPYQTMQMTARRSVQMRLQLEQESKRWKIVAFTPADFFSMTYNQQGVTR